MKSLHLLAQRSDISRCLAQTVATVMMGIELIAQLLKHGRKSVARDVFGCRFRAIPFVTIAVSLKARHCNFFSVSCASSKRRGRAMPMTAQLERVVCLQRPRGGVGKLLANSLRTRTSHLNFHLNIANLNATTFD